MAKLLLTGGRLAIDANGNEIINASNVIPAYRAGIAYSLGDQVVDNDKLFIANKDIATSPDTLNTADWDEAGSGSESSGGLDPYSRSQSYVTNNVVSFNNDLWIATGNIPSATDNTSDPGVNANWLLLTHNEEDLGNLINSARTIPVSNGGTTHTVREGGSFRVTAANAATLHDLSSGGYIELTSGAVTALGLSTTQNQTLSNPHLSFTVNFGGINIGYSWNLTGDVQYTFADRRITFTEALWVNTGSRDSLNTLASSGRQPAQERAFVFNYGAQVTDPTTAYVASPLTVNTNNEVIYKGREIATVNAEATDDLVGTYTLPASTTPFNVTFDLIHDITDASIVWSGFSQNLTTAQETAGRQTVSVTLTSLQANEINTNAAGTRPVLQYTFNGEQIQDTIFEDRVSDLVERVTTIEGEIDPITNVTPGFAGFTDALGGNWDDTVATPHPLTSIYQTSNDELTITPQTDGQVGGGSLPLAWRNLRVGQVLYGFNGVTPDTTAPFTNNSNYSFTVAAVGGDTSVTLTADAAANTLLTTEGDGDAFGALYTFTDAEEATLFGGLRLEQEHGHEQDAIVVSTEAGVLERAVIGSNFQIDRTTDGAHIINTNNPEINIQTRTGLSGGGTFTGNQLNNGTIPLDVNVNDPALNNIPGILENAAEIARLTNNGLSTHRHSATPPYFVPHPNQAAGNAAGNQIAYTGATGSAFGDLTFRISAVAANNVATDADVAGTSTGDNGIIRRANYWQPSQALDRSAGLRRFANEYRNAYLPYQGGLRHVQDRQIILRGNRTGPDEADSGGLYDRLEILTSWAQIRRDSRHPLWDEGAALSTAAGSITLYNGNTALTEGFANYTGWQVALTDLDVGALHIPTNEVSPWDSNMRLAYMEGVICFQTSDNSNDGTVSAQGIASNACIPVRRVVEYDPATLATQTNFTEAGQNIFTRNRARYWEFPNNNFTQDVIMPWDQPFQIFWLAPAISTSFAAANPGARGRLLEDATQLTRREVNSRWTGLPFAAFGDPNGRDWITGAAEDNIARRNNVTEVRLYVNGSTVNDATLTEIVGMPESSSGAGDGTGWRGLPAFVGTATDGGQYAQIGLAYQHNTPTENPNVIITKNPDTSTPAGDNQLEVRNGEIGTTFERLVIGAQSSGLNYLRIQFQDGAGDHEIALNTPLGITEIYDEFYSEGRNLGYDLHTLAHNRPINVFPLPIDDTWLPDSISSDITGNAATATTATDADRADSLAIGNSTDNTNFAVPFFDPNTTVAGGNPPYYNVIHNRNVTYNPSTHQLTIGSSTIGEAAGTIELIGPGATAQDPPVTTTITAGDAIGGGGDNKYSLYNGQRVIFTERVGVSQNEREYIGTSRDVFTAAVDRTASVRSRVFFTISDTFYNDITDNTGAITSGTITQIPLSRFAFRRADTAELVYAQGQTVEAGAADSHTLEVSIKSIATDNGTDLFNTLETVPNLATIWSANSMWQIAEITDFALASPAPGFDIANGDVVAYEEILTAGATSTVRQGVIDSFLAIDEGNYVANTTENNGATNGRVQFNNLTAAQYNDFVSNVEDHRMVLSIPGVNVRYFGRIVEPAATPATDVTTDNQSIVVQFFDRKANLGDNTNDVRTAPAGFPELTEVRDLVGELHLGEITDVETVGTGGTGELFASAVQGTPANIQLNLVTPPNATFDIASGLAWSVGQPIQMAVGLSTDTSMFGTAQGTVSAYSATSGQITVNSISIIGNGRGTLPTTTELVTPLRVFGAGAEGPAGPQGVQGVGIVAGQTLDPTQPISEGTSTQFTIDLTNPANAANPPAGVTFTVPAGAKGSAGAQGPRGAFTIEAYTTAATAPEAPQSGTGAFNATNFMLTTAPTASTTGAQVTWRISVADATTNRQAGELFYISRAFFNPATNTIGEWSAPFEASAQQGPEGPPGPAGAPVLDQFFFNFTADVDGNGDRVLNQFTAAQLDVSTTPQDVTTFYLGQRFDSNNAPNGITDSRYTANQDQSINDNTLSLQSSVVIRGLDNGNNIQYEAIGTLTSRNVLGTGVRPATGQMQVTIDAVITPFTFTDTITETGSDWQWSMSLTGEQGRQGDPGRDASTGTWTLGQNTITNPGNGTITSATGSIQVEDVVINGGTVTGVTAPSVTDGVIRLAEVIDWVLNLSTPASGISTTTEDIGGQTGVLRITFENNRRLTGTWYQWVNVQVNSAGDGFDALAGGSVFSNNTNPFAAGAQTINT